MRRGCSTQSDGLSRSADRFACTHCPARNLRECRFGSTKCSECRFIILGGIGALCLAQRGKGILVVVLIGAGNGYECFDLGIGLHQ